MIWRLLLVFGLAGSLQGAVLFTTDFNTVTGAGTFLGAGSFEPLSPGNPFLFNDSTGRPAAATRLVLNSLPAHSHLSLTFTLWVLDSWDGLTNTCCGNDIFTIQLDGVTVFSGAFRNWGISPARLDTVTPSGAATLVLGMNTNLAANPSWADSVWLISLPDLAHAAATAEFRFYAGGSGWDGLTDEAFGLDNLTVEGTLLVPEAGTVWTMGLGLLLLGTQFTSLTKRG